MNNQYLTIFRANNMWLSLIYHRNIANQYGYGSIPRKDDTIFPFQGDERPAKSQRFFDVNRRGVGSGF